MAKVELIKKVKPNGEKWYIVEVDGVHQDSFQSQYKEEAEQFYEQCVEHANKAGRTVLKSFDSGVDG